MRRKRRALRHHRSLRRTSYPCYDTKIPRDHPPPLWRSPKACPPEAYISNKEVPAVFLYGTCLHASASATPSGPGPGRARRVVRVRGLGSAGPAVEGEGPCRLPLAAAPAAAGPCRASPRHREGLNGATGVWRLSRPSLLSTPLGREEPVTLSRAGLGEWGALAALASSLSVSVGLCVGEHNRYA